MINDYHIIKNEQNYYLQSQSKGIKISSKVLGEILNIIKMQDKLEISQSELKALVIPPFLTGAKSRGLGH